VDDKAARIVTMLLGILLVVAAGLKGYEVMTQPAVEKDIFSARWFLIFQVEFEIALGAWLLSGVLRKAAWLAALCCFCVFAGVTFYRGLSGAASCGCFGPVHVNPWVTLSAVDLPAVIALAVFRPRSRKFLDWPPVRRLAGTLVCVGVLVGTSLPMLAFNRPASVSSSYEVLEPESWIGNKLPILRHIDIADTLRKGRWLVLLYHHDCPDCAAAMGTFRRWARDFARGGSLVRIAFVEVPPYGPSPVSGDGLCLYGRMAETKQWFVTTPAVVLTENATVRNAWEGRVPDLVEVVPGESGVSCQQGIEKFRPEWNWLCLGLFCPIAPSVQTS